jgi:MFS family permease
MGPLSEMRALESLTVPAFRRLATSYTLNELTWSFGTIALAVLVYERTGSALATTLLFLATTFAPALLAPALTARLDQLPVRRALPGLYLAEAALFAALVAVSGRFSLPVLLALALADGAVAIVARALTRAAVAAALKPTGALEAGNKVLNVLFSIAYATGPAVAGVVVAAAGVRVSLMVCAGLFGLMALALATARSLPSAPGGGDRSWMTRLRGGLAYVRENRAVRRVLGAHASILALGAVLSPTEVVYVNESLHAGARGYGILLAAWGIGTVLSSVALARARTASPIVLIPLCGAAMGAGFLVMGLAPGLAVAAVGSLLGGAGNGVYYVSVVQAIQDRIPDDLQARVMGLLESVTAAAFGVGFLLGGALAALVHARFAILVAGAGVLIACAVVVHLLRGDRAAVAPEPAVPEPAVPEPALRDRTLSEPAAPVDAPARVAEPAPA